MSSIEDGRAAHRARHGAGGDEISRVGETGRGTGAGGPRAADGTFEERKQAVLRRGGALAGSVAAGREAYRVRHGVDDE